jgi:hypothetical protein
MSEAPSIVTIDPNVRVRDNQTYSGLEDVMGPIEVGQPVWAFEPECGVSWQARVAEIDHTKQLVFLDVDWSRHSVPLNRKRFEEMGL